jgi:hypothetical protein
MGFFAMIAAALQRRIWIGHEEKPIFPNLYTILTGEPGMGKTQVLLPIIECMKFHKISNKNESLEKLRRYEETIGNKIMDPESIKTMLEMFTQQESGSYKGYDEIKQDPLVFPMGPEAVTFETRRKNTGIKSKMSPNGIYTHSSMVFVLEEISSLFPRQCEKVVNYLVKSYDCGDFEYHTKHQGIDIVRKPCLNFIGGTTPKFMEDTFTDKLIGEGFSARTLFVYAAVPRSYRFGPSTYSPEQLQCKLDIIKHLKDLSELYGEVKYSPESLEYFRQYFEEILPTKRANFHPKLTPYYARKNIHAPKLAMAIHFSYSLDMVLRIEDCVLALSILDALEENMHFALNFGGKNPLALGTKRVIKLLNTHGPMTKYEIWLKTEGEFGEKTLEEIIKFIVTTNQVEVNRTDYKDKNGQTAIKYVSLGWKKLEESEGEQSENQKEAIG